MTVSTSSIKVGNNGANCALICSVTSTEMGSVSGSESW